MGIKKRGAKRGRLSARDQSIDAEIHAEMQNRIQQDKQRKHLGEMRDAELSLKSVERKKVRETGKTPFFYSQGAIRKHVLETKRASKKKGSVRDTNAERRERKAAQRDKKRMPARRDRETEA